MDEIWRAAPSPALRLWRDDPVNGWQVNAAASHWAQGRMPERTQAPALWLPLVAHLRAAVWEEAAHTGEFVSLGLHWQAVALADGALVWLMPAAPVPEGASGIWRSAEEKLAMVQDVGAIGVFERNLVTGVGRWDAQLFRLFGLTPQEQPPPFSASLACVHEDDRTRFVQAYEQLLRDHGRRTLRYRVVLLDGRVRDLVSLVEVRPAGPAGDATMVGVVVDESDAAGRVRAQEAISAQLARAISLAQVSVWRIDNATRRIHFNEVGYSMSNLAPSAEGLPLEKLRDLVHPDDRGTVQRALEAALESRDAVDAEARYVSPRGGYLHLFTRRVAERDEQGRVIGLMGIGMDQSAQVAERQRAQALARRIELVAEAAELGIWSVDLETRAVEWNEQMFRIYGLSPEAGPPATGDWLAGHVHPDDRPRLRALRRRALRADEQAVEVEFRICRPDGSVRWVVSRSRRDQHDGRRLMVGIHLDTTDVMAQRTLAERAVSERQAAQRASRAKSEFLSRASHELRTPLNAVLGFAQLMELDAPGTMSATQRERVTHIRSAGEHLLSLVDDVLDLAGIEAGRLPVANEPVAIDEAIREVMRWLGPQAQQAQVTLHLQISGGWVMADARRLRQIVANLLNNAIKFNHPGGAVWLGAVPAVVAGAPAWQLVVRDDGRGLASVQRAHLFEAFQRLGAEREGIEGVGLGLAIVRQLAEAMGGTVAASSAPGQGSEFRVTLAAAAGGAQPPSATAAAVPEAAVLSLLYIEDNPVNVILIQGLVALRPGVELRVAENGLAGVEIAMAERPHVVLIDLQLPDINGLEVLRRLRTAPELVGTLLIALSANSLPEDIAHAKASGFDDYWTKPIDFKQFLARLDAIVAGLQASPNRR